MKQVLETLNQLPQILEEYSIDKDGVGKITLELDNENNKVQVLLYNVKDVRKFEGVRTEEELLDHLGNVLFYYADHKGITFESNMQMK